MDALGMLRYQYLERERRRAIAAGQRRAYALHMKNLRDESNPYDMPEKKFRGRFSLSRDIARALTEELRPFLRAGVRNSAIPVELKILSALHFFGQGNYQKSVGSDCVVPMSQPSVSKALEEVVTAINHPQVLRNHIVFPSTPDDRRKLALRNYQRYPYIPGVLGMVDGTYVAIRAPLEHEEQHMCRKKYHALNVQVCCDVNYNILNVVARYPAATHDSFIWANSALRRTMEDLFRTGEEYWLLGDSGYPHEPWLHTPIVGAAEGTREANYTTAHMITRSSVERTIGHLKARFRCLNKHRVLHYDPEKAGKIVNCCVVLHNMCIAVNVPQPESDEEDSNSDDEAEDNPAQPAHAPAPAPLRILHRARMIRERLVIRTGVVPPAVRPEGGRRHR